MEQNEGTKIPKEEKKNIYDEMKKALLENLNPENWKWGGYLIPIGMLGFFAVLIPFKLLGGFLPSQLTWVKDSFAIIAGIIGVGIAALCLVTTKDSQEAMKVGVKWSFYISIALIAFTIMASLVPNQQENLKEVNKKITGVTEQLQNGTLNDAQVEQVGEILVNKQVVTLEDLNKIGLNSQQSQEVLDLLYENGFTKKEDVVSIVNTVNAQDRIYVQETATAVAGTTQTAVFTTCYIEVDPQYSDVMVHKLPIKNSEAVDYIVRDGGRLVVLGHGGGTVNVDKMWLVETHHGDTAIRGWVGSWAVVEINEPACALVKQYP